METVVAYLRNFGISLGGLRKTTKKKLRLLGVPDEI
jgi:hypothetical protein